MSLEENKALVYRFHEGFNTQNLDLSAAVVAPDVVVKGVPAGLPAGLEGLRGMGMAFIAAFPDGHTEVEGVIAEGDTVVAWGTFTGTQRGEFMGIPATGRRVQYDWMSLDRIANGKIVEHRIQQDNLTMMQQLGLVPAQ
jgi:steroid delta-isomerase-like uncharacterized protein